MKELYFKDEYHKEDAKRFLEAFGKADYFYDVEYGTLACVQGVASKTNDLLSVIDEDDKLVDIEKLHEILSVYSSSEQKMIRFAIQCFNSSIDDISLIDVVSSLDNENLRVIKTALKSDTSKNCCKFGEILG